MSIKWQGLDKVLKNLNKEVDKIKNKTVDGMLEAGLLVKGDALRIVPVQFGNLKGSAYVVWGGNKKTPKDDKTSVFNLEGPSGARVQAEHGDIVSSKKKSQKDPFAVIGFTAFYALEVHENLAIARKAGKQAKFLEQSLMQNKREILSIIKRRAAIK